MKPTSSPAAVRNTAKASGWRRHQCSAIRAEASPSWRPTMASTASRSAGPAGPAWTVPSVSQSNTARMMGLLRCR
jgi:hypothetical protein